MNIASLLPVDAVIPHLHARDKKQVLKMLSAHATKFCTLSEKEIFSTLTKREDASCTGIGNGVCIPHTRFDSLNSPYIVFARLDKAVNFDAADGKKVDLVFLLLSPESDDDTEHLKILATLSKLLRDKKLCDVLRTTEDAAKMHELLTTDYSKEKKVIH
ncbi:MAG: PTS sugar transporter subunit IIA [Rickettsiales bacterium]